MTSKRGNLSYLDLADTDVKSLMNKAFSWTLSESSLSDFDSKLISIILPKIVKKSVGKFLTDVQDYKSFLCQVH